ncbi:MAG TPA: carboxypeptidase-like regulatory domain-containing protein [Pseudomonadota bacterium]|nr:carboxypeptidase-like regulatory domain-containing protein [Pseudomonadota bacterium]
MSHKTRSFRVHSALLFAAASLTLGTAGCGEAIDNFLSSERSGAYILGQVRGIAFNLPISDATVDVFDPQNEPQNRTQSDAGGEFVISELPIGSEQRILIRSNRYWPLIGMINTKRSTDGDPIWTPAMMDTFVVDLQAKRVDDKLIPGTGLLYLELQEPDGADWKGAPDRTLNHEQLGSPYYFNESNWLDKNQHATAGKGSAIFVNVPPGWYSLALPGGCVPYWAFDFDASGKMPAFVAADTVTELTIRCF